MHLATDSSATRRAPVPCPEGLTLGASDATRLAGISGSVKEQSTGGTIKTKSSLQTSTREWALFYRLCYRDGNIVFQKS
jgi:hypothetical protein